MHQWGFRYHHCPSSGDLSRGYAHPHTTTQAVDPGLEVGTHEQVSPVDGRFQMAVVAIVDKEAAPEPAQRASCWTAFARWYEKCPPLVVWLLDIAGLRTRAITLRPAVRSRNLRPVTRVAEAARSSQVQR